MSRPVGRSVSRSLFRGRIDPGWQLAIGLLLALRLGTELVAVVSLHLQPGYVASGDWLNLVDRGSSWWSQLTSVWQRWDALWFQQIAENGYHAGDGTSHFQPLFPLASRIASGLTAGSVLDGELLAASLFFALSMWLLYRVARLDVDDQEARLAVLLIALWPEGFFLLAPYSEGLFLSLSLGAFWAMRADRLWLAAVAGFGAGLTRTVGIFLILPLAFLYLRRREQRGKTVLGPGLAAAAAPGLGLIATTLYSKLIVGEPLSPLQLNAHWGDHFVPFWQLIPESVDFIQSTGDPIELLNLLSLLGFTVLGVLMLWRLPLAYGLYVLPEMAMLADSHLLISPLASVARYVLVLFPCFILLARYLGPRPHLALGWLIVSGMIQALLLEHWVHFGFVS